MRENERKTHRHIRLQRRIESPQDPGLPRVPIKGTTTHVTFPSSFSSSDPFVSLKRN